MLLTIFSYFAVRPGLTISVYFLILATGLWSMYLIKPWRMRRVAGLWWNNNERLCWCAFFLVTTTAFFIFLYPFLLLHVGQTVSREIYRVILPIGLLYPSGIYLLIKMFDQSMFPGAPCPYPKVESAVERTGLIIAIVAVASILAVFFWNVPGTLYGYYETIKDVMR
jgi:hypothetical protein